MSIYFDFYKTSFQLNNVVPNAPLADVDFVPAPNLLTIP